MLRTSPHLRTEHSTVATMMRATAALMLPVVAGRAAITQHVVIYSIVLAPTSVLRCRLGRVGLIYGATAVICGAILVVLAFHLHRSSKADRRIAHRPFAFSIIYLFVLPPPVGSACGSTILTTDEA